MGDNRERESQAIREELQRILASAMFLHSERLRRFLSHCVDAALAGRIDDVKEYTIGIAAFDRPRNYNPAEDPIVRVEARRLRRKLDEYYAGPGAADPVLIQLPKGGYLPLFEMRRRESPRPPRRAAALYVAVCGLGLSCAAFGFWFFGRDTRQTELTLERLTSDHRLATDPALSVDGSLLVYASDRAETGGLDIWLQSVARGEAPRRLTDDPADDSQPAVSADGSTIAFRSERQPPGIYTVATSGGPAKLLAPDGRNPRYSPDGRWLAYWVGSPGGDVLPPAGKLYVMPAGGGSPQRLLGNFTSSACPAWSPQSDRLVVEAIEAPAESLDLWSVSLQHDRARRIGLSRMMEEGRLHFALRDCSASWGRDAIVFSAAQGDTMNLWRLPVPADGRPAGRMERVTFGSAEEVLPFADASGAMVFAGRSESLDVWRLRLDRPDELVRITEGFGEVSFPNVRGDKLTFLSKTAERPAVWLKNLNSGQSTRLAPSAKDPRYPQLCPDEETVVYSDGPNSFASKPQSPGGRLLCNGCSRVWQCTDRGLFVVPAGSKSPVEIKEFLFPAGPASPLLADSRHDLANAQMSPDGRWLAFHVITGAAQRRIFVAPYRPGQVVAPGEWIPITDGSQMDRNAVWSERSDTVYFLSERCGFRCIWSQRLDPATKKAAGPAVAVRHFHSASRGLSAIGDVGAIGLSYGAGSLYFTLADESGEIWLARPRSSAKSLISRP